MKRLTATLFASFMLTSVNADAGPCAPHQSKGCVRQALELCTGQGSMNLECINDLAKTCASTKSCEGVDPSETIEASAPRISQPTRYCIKEDPMVLDTNYQLIPPKTRCY